MTRTRISGTLLQPTPATPTNAVLSKMSTIIGDERDDTESSTFSTNNKENSVRGNSSKSSSDDILTKRSTTQVSTDVQDVRVDSDVTGRGYHYLSHIVDKMWRKLNGNSIEHIVYWFKCIKVLKYWNAEAWFWKLHLCRQFFIGVGTGKEASLLAKGDDTLLFS